MSRSLKSFKPSDRKAIALSRTAPNVTKGLGYWGSFDYLHRAREQSEQSTK